MPEAGGTGNAFFLEFSSDAPAFGAEVATGLEPGIASINALRRAMEKYETVAGRLKGQPVSISFQGLDQAATRIQAATEDFTRTFGAQMTALMDRIAGLAESLASGARYAPAAAGEPIAARRAAVPVTEPEVAPVVDFTPQRIPNPPREPREPAIPKIIQNRPPLTPRTNSDRADAIAQARLTKFYEDNPGAEEADQRYQERMVDYLARRKVYNQKRGDWEQKAATVQAQNDAAYQKALEESQAKATASAAVQTYLPAATQVPEADIRAASSTRTQGDSLNVLAEANSALGATVEQLSSSLEQLNARVKAVTEGLAPGAAEESVAQVGVREPSRAVLAEEQAKTAARTGSISEPVGRPAPALDLSGLQAREHAYEQSVLAKLEAELQRAESRAAGQYENLNEFNPLNHDEVVEAQRRLDEARGAAGITPPPPRPPAPPISPEPEPEPEKPRGQSNGRLSQIGEGRRDLSTDAERQRQFAKLAPETQQALSAARADLERLAIEDQKNAIVQAQQRGVLAQAGAVFKADPALRETFQNASHRGNAFADFLGINPALRGNVSLVHSILKNGGLADDLIAPKEGTLPGGTKPPTTPASRSAAPVQRTDEHEARNASLLAQVDQILAESSGNLAKALTQQAVAQAEVNRLTAQGNPDAREYAAAQLRLAEASRQVEQSMKTESANTSGWSQFTGSTRSRTFAQDLRRHIGYAVENTIGYTLVFSGYEKLKEIVETGLQAQAQMVRLNASLQETGKSTDGVANSMAKISANTATPIQHVIEAASELAGVFKNTSDLEFATNIAAQLANISQGLLTAREAAIGLRDVTAAYGLETPKELQGVGDNIAALSQRTGVSVKDITEGTTQLAQEANDFGLSQRQTSALAAYITQGTGETGESSAEQASRLLSTLYNTKVQNVLVRNGVTDAGNFAKGNIAQVLEDIVTKYGTLNPSQRQEIASLVGSGRQARAFAALTNGGQNFVEEFTGHGQVDTGALGRQNTAFLDTIEGRIRKLSEDFQNLGVVLQQAHVFDILGAAAGVADKLATALAFVVRAFNDVANANPLSTNLTRLVVILIEANAAAKLLRATIGSNFLAGAFGRTAATSTVAAGEAGVAGTAAVGTAAAGAAAAGAAGAAGAAETGALSVAEARLSAALDALAVALGVDRVALIEHIAAMDADSIAVGENALAQGLGGLGGLRGLGGVAGRGAVREGEAVGSQEAFDKFAAGEATGAVAARRPGLIGRTLGGVRGLFARGAAEAVPFLGEFGTPLAIGALAAYPVLNGAFNAKGQSEALHKKVEELTGYLKDKQATDDSSNQKVEELYTAAQNSGAGTGLSGVAQDVGNFAPSLFGAHPFGDDGGSGNPSRKSQNASDKIYQRGQQLLRQGVKDKSAEELLKAYDSINNEIVKNAEKIAKAGGNGSRAQAAVYEDLQTLRAGLKSQVGDAIKGIEGLHLFHEDLSLTQAQLLQAYTQSVGSLSPRTIREQGNALLALFANSGTSLGTSQYKEAQMLAGYVTTPPTHAEKYVYNQQEVQFKQDEQTYQDQYAEYQKKLAVYNSSKLKIRNDYTGAGDIGRQVDLSDINTSKLTDDQRRAFVQYSAGIPGAELPAGLPLKGGGTTQVGSAQLKQQAGISTPPAAPTAPTPPQSHQEQTNLSAVEQQKILMDLYQSQISTLSQVAQGIDPKTHKTLNNKGKAFYTQEQRSQAATELQTALQGYQSAQDQVQQLPVQLAANRSQALVGIGNYSGAANALNQQVTALQNMNKTLKATDPQYWQNITQIQQLRTQIAQTLATPQQQALQAQVANSLNPLAAARAQQKLAQLQIEDAKKAYDAEVADAKKLLADAQAALDKFLATWDGHGRGDQIALIQGDQAKIDAARKYLDGLLGTGGNTPELGAGKAAKSAADATAAQAQEATNQARAQANMAGIRNTKQLAEAQLAEALREEAVYRSQGNEASAFQAQAQAEQAQIAIRDAVEQQKESAIKAAAALDTRHGDAVGASRLNLRAAQSAYTYAVQQYGKDSQQAMDALQTLYQAQSETIAAELAKQNAAIELRIAQLNFRGGAGDAERVAQAQLREAQNALKSYLGNGGKRGTAEYDQLEGAILSAKRNAIDTAVNAHIDTLDFQRETYKITSAQEVQALQQILKNKQLTLAEQRSITLKIKDLQQSIRQQLTEGGLNIPSDIKLPTAYEVRRSLGAGFAGGGTTVSTVNNNNQQVTITNNVPNAQVANAIANQVISAINTQTGMHLRANSSTPRLVTTR